MSETPSAPSEVTVASAPAPELPAAPEPAKSLGESLYPDAVEKAVTDSVPPTEGETTAKVEGETATEAEASAPTTYTPDSYIFTLPEGFTENPEAMTEAKSIFAEGGMRPELAQKLMDRYAADIAAASQSAAAAATAQFTELNTRWTSELNAMPEFQGEAKKQTSAVLGRAMDEFGSAEAREAFNLTGAGNNPAIVRYILNLAQAVVEGSPTPSGAPPSERKQPRSLGQRLYPNQTN